MTKKTKSQKTKNRQSLIFDRGEKVEFPVKSGIKYASFQRKQPIKSIKQIQDFVCVGATHNWAGKELNIDLGQLKVAIVEIECLDFIVPHDTTVILQNPVNRIKAPNVEIGGNLISYGYLSIDCQEIRGGSGIVEIVVPDGYRGEDHGGDAKPNKAQNGVIGANAWSDLNHLFSAGRGGDGVWGTRGLSGGEGGRGNDGAKLIISTETLGPDIICRCRGGNGGDGGDGQEGGDGGDGGRGGDGFGVLPGGDGGDGGRGGDGGLGGRGGFGGNGGTIEVNCRIDGSYGSNIYDVSGGRAGHRGFGGAPGLGGLGGDPGQNTAISIGSCRRGTDGDNGRSGSTPRDGQHELGRDGANGTVNINMIP